VIGVDLTPAYVAFAANAARAEGLSARFECMDIREVPYAGMFDAVLSMADGAVGYLETDAENQKIFDVIARALKPGGRHFLDVCNAEHAEKHFPKKWWECGAHALALAQFDWDAQTRRMLYAGWDVPFGQPAERPVVGRPTPSGCTTPAELSSQYAARGMRMLAAYSDYEGHPASDARLQLLTTAEKTR
jgi:SAM-dependent methyltransferase